MSVTRPNTGFSPKAEYDIAIIGGGIHGASMAKEAAQRGLSVLLVQGNDLASGASGVQRAVLTGGLQALSQFNLAEVSSQLKELQRWNKLYPNTAKKVRAHVIANEQLRSNTRVKTGLALYHRLAGEAPPYKALSPSSTCKPPPYFSCLAYRVKPARQIINLAREAASLGADIFTRARVNKASRKKQSWQLEIESCHVGAQGHASTEATMVINCCGWLANTLLTDVLGVTSRAQAQARKAAIAYLSGPFEAPPLPAILQASDRQLVSITPITKQHYVMGPFSEESMGDASNPTQIIRDALLEHLGGGVAQWINTLNVDAVKWLNYAQVSDPCGGVHRADFLQDNILDLNNPSGGAPLLNVFGINVAKHAKLAKQGLDILAPFTRGLTAKVAPIDCLENTWAPSDCSPLIQRWHATYQHGATVLMNEAKLERYSPSGREPEQLGIHFGEDLYQCEVDYLIRYEWASSAEDILWRRGDWGPWFPSAGVKMLEEYVKSRLT